MLRYVARGLSKKEVASTMHLSVKTIGTHRENIKTKLGLQHAPQLIKMAVSWFGGSPS